MKFPVFADPGLSRMPMLLRVRRNSAGFTLVETVLALGVVAFSMMGILGMLIVGLTSFREAVNATAESQIVQSVSNDILLTDYSFLMSKEYPYTRYFDEQGNEVPSGDTGRYFEAEVEKDAVSAPGVDTTTAATFIIRMKNPKLRVPNLYPIIIPKG
ncbi:MAG: Verru_Chthon cassette protein B [Candidatus Methylacidiphilales bacterium]|nr:Verru_Chthon cassette protein B [Candidatus Methylacidiphilales bacterium]